MRVLILLTALLIAGCHHWARPQTPDEEARWQHYLCVREADSVGGSDLSRGYYRDVCMEAHGFRWTFGR